MWGLMRMKKTKKDNLKYLYEYILNKDAALQNDIIQLNNNMAYRETDYMDCMNLMIAKCRYDMAAQIFKDLATVMSIIRSNGGV